MASPASERVAEERMALLASFAVRPFFGGAAVSSLYFSNSAVHFSYAPKMPSA